MSKKLNVYSIKNIVSIYMHQLANKEISHLLFRTLGLLKSIGQMHLIPFICQRGKPFI